MRNRRSDELIDIRDQAMVSARRPLLIAHRGGVVGPHSPENTLAAIELAGLYGYDMVELDVRLARDGEPFVFHDNNLARSCGVDRVPEDLTSAELRSIRHLASDEHVPTLDEALAACRRRNLGIMLDMKARLDTPARGGPPFPPPFLERLGRLVTVHGLAGACVTITGDPTLRESLVRYSLLTVTDAEVALAMKGDDVSLRERFWFGLRQDLPESAIRALHAAGAFVIPAINAFRYPAHAHRELARRDVRYFLDEGVDGFQIDSVYQEFFVP